MARKAKTESEEPEGVDAPGEPSDADEGSDTPPTDDDVDPTAAAPEGDEPAALPPAPDGVDQPAESTTEVVEKAPVVDIDPALLLLGEVVHFRHDFSGRVCAAIVIDVHDAEQGIVDLAVFSKAGETRQSGHACELVYRIPRAAEPAIERGRWAFPPGY